ncbi:DUF3800 domain-containing protein [Mesorhizobium sp. B2-4-14]|uniref:DUF3800 domain-containing protein n=1 Tax=Mesorhizobium sp. B2-4-14 TaxID=2589935 RepID=UPI0015E37257|nr:DUF3800 domain-containing protein [Mesorhizobium sp. B2-4-14]
MIVNSTPTRKHARADTVSHRPLQPESRGQSAGGLQRICARLAKDCPTECQEVRLAFADDRERGKAGTVQRSLRGPAARPISGRVFRTLNFLVFTDGNDRAGAERLTDQNELYLYVDDSGSRFVTRHPGDIPKFDYFALGGVIIRESDKPAAKSKYGHFCKKWNIDYPLHSVKIRNASGPFRWIARLGARREEFFTDLHEMMRSPGLHALASTVHRPGYVARYKEKFPDSKWKLCQTVFPILVERAVRYAIQLDTKLHIYVERSGGKEDRLIERYVDEVQVKGMPFDKSNSVKYAPLQPTDFSQRISEFDFKNKETRLMQIADLMLYAVARGRYEPTYKAYAALARDKMLFDSLFSAEEVPFRGSKYSCFDNISEKPEASGITACENEFEPV